MSETVEAGEMGYPIKVPFGGIGIEIFKSKVVFGTNPPVAFTPSSLQDLVDMAQSAQKGLGK